MQDPWILGEKSPTEPLPLAVVQSLSAFAVQCRLQKAVGRVLAQSMADDDKQSLSEVFRRFDKNKDGLLGAPEVAAMMKHIGGGDLRSVFANLDQDESGQVSQVPLLNASDCLSVACLQQYLMLPRCRLLGGVLCGRCRQHTDIGNHGGTQGDLFHV